MRIIEWRSDIVSLILGIRHGVARGMREWREWVGCMVHRIKGFGLRLFLLRFTPLFAKIFEFWECFRESERGEQENGGRGKAD